jgi:hypothetical protein
MEDSPAPGNTLWKGVNEGPRLGTRMAKLDAKSSDSETDTWSAALTKQSQIICLINTRLSVRILADLELLSW